MTDKPPELQACPFCGYEPRIPYKDTVECCTKSCNMHGYPFKTSEWNTRADLPVVDDKRTADVEVLKGVRDALGKIAMWKPAYDLTGVQCRTIARPALAALDLIIGRMGCLQR